MFFFFLGLVFINLFIFYNNYFFLFLLFVDICFLGRKIDFKLLIVSGFVFLSYYTVNADYFNYIVEETVIDKDVIVLEKYDKYSVVGKNEERYLIYNGDYVFYKGSKIYVQGKVSYIKNTYNSFYNYLNKKGVNYKIDYYKLYVLDNNKMVNEIIVDKLLENKTESSKSYLKLMLFNVKDENNEGFYTVFSIYSLTYLIAVSGFHIRILLTFFKKIFHNSFVGYCVVSFYLYLLDFSVSSYRAFLCYIFKRVNKKLNFSLSNNDVVSIIGSIFIIINPSIMFSYGFIFSFLGTFVLEIFDGYSKKQFFTSFYLYLINIPIVLFSHYKLNLSTILFSFLLTVPISFLYIFSFLFLFLDKFYLVYELVFILFFKLFKLLNNLNLILIFGKPSVVFIIIYYLFLLMFFICRERKRNSKFIYILLLFFLLFYQYNKPILNSNEKVYFLNVGQGDCTVFIIPNRKEAVILDTGGNKYSDVAINKIIPFLEREGVNEVRKVIISHDDFDHNGALDSLIENFDVDSIINTSNIDCLQIGNKMFYNLNINDSRDNDGSLVLYGEYAGYNILLMGDASKKVEEEIVDEINGVDIIKIGHHGSNTSSSYNFLESINGKIAIISVGENNMYGHPHQEVLDYLEKLHYVVLRTDENNNIGFGKNILGISFVDYFK